MNRAAEAGSVLDQLLLELIMPRKREHRYDVLGIRAARINDTITTRCQAAEMKRNSSTKRSHLSRFPIVCRDTSAHDADALQRIARHDVSDRKRAELELLQLNATLQKQLVQRTELLKILQYVTRVSSEAKTVDEAIQAAIASIANYCGWMIGHAWRLADDDSGQLESSKVWYIREDAPPRKEQFLRFRQVTHGTRILPGEGLVGSVLKTGSPQWVGDIAKRTDAQELRDLGVHSAIAFPITVESRAVAVMEFLSDDVTKPQEGLLEIAPDIGIQLGHAIARKRVDRIMAEVASAEQQRIGRELHDGIAQQLTGGALIAQSMIRNLPADTALHERLEHVAQILKQAHQDVRRLSHGLLMTEIRADDLLPAIQKLAKETTERHQLRCVVRHSQFQEAFVNVDFVAFVIFQIVREAVHNAVKHAGADEIVIELTCDASFRARISDNGIGIGVAQKPRGSSQGLRIMRHRAQSVGGQLNTKSTEGGGTHLLLTIPQRSCQHVEHDPRPHVSHRGCR